MLKIWILDSGMGWHYAMLDISSRFPEYEYETYLDYLNAPYWDRSGEEIFTLTQTWCASLWERWCNIILIACNTICSETLKKLQNKYPEKKILWCIVPSCEIAVQESAGNIWLIATKFTINSWKYQVEISKLSSSHTLYSRATPELVKYIESWKSDTPECREYLDKYVQLLVQENIDTLILGCTHYSILSEYIEQQYPHLKIIDSAKTQTMKLWEYLERHKELLK